jgi:folate-binding protein YgfZ
LRLPDRWLLIGPREMLSPTANRLRMFVLRAKVELALSDEWHVAALVGADDAWLAAHALASATPPGGVHARGDLRWVRIGARLWYAVGPRAATSAFEPALPRINADEVALEEIRLGVPAIGASLTERFVPQMLNLDQLDALSFDKGCYPGQEVIARVHHRGAVKRRMRRYGASSATPAAPATPVVDGTGVGVGEVVRAARAGDGTELLAVVDHTAAGGALNVDGAPLRELPLPYVVPME